MDDGYSGRPNGFAQKKLNKKKLNGLFLNISISFIKEIKKDWFMLLSGFKKGVYKKGAYKKDNLYFNPVLNNKNYQFSAQELSLKKRIINQKIEKLQSQIEGLNQPVTLGQVDALKIQHEVDQLLTEGQKLALELEKVNEILKSQRSQN